MSETARKYVDLDNFLLFCFSLPQPSLTSSFTPSCLPSLHLTSPPPLFSFYFSLPLLFLSLVSSLLISFLSLFVSPPPSSSPLSPSPFFLLLSHCLDCWFLSPPAADTSRPASSARAPHQPGAVHPPTLCQMRPVLAVTLAASPWPGGRGVKRWRVVFCFLELSFSFYCLICRQS